MFTYKKAFNWATSQSCSLIIFVLIGVSETITLLLCSCVVVKTEYLVS